MTTRQSWLATSLIVVLPLVSYPALVAGDGARFPSRDDCIRIAPADTAEELDLVFGRRDTPAQAEALRERVANVGYVDAEVRRDGCGRWEVLYDGITSWSQGVESRAEARGAGLDAELEIEPPS